MRRKLCKFYSRKMRANSSKNGGLARLGSGKSNDLFDPDPTPRSITGSHFKNGPAAAPTQIAEAQKPPSPIPFLRPLPPRQQTFPIHRLPKHVLTRHFVSFRVAPKKLSPQSYRAPRLRVSA